MEPIPNLQGEKIIDINSIPEFENLNDESVLCNLEKNQDAIETELSELLLQLNEEPPKDLEVSSVGDKIIETVIDGILGPFMLSRAMFKDKDGGSSTTTHNARKGIYAKEKEEYNRSKDYNPGFNKAKEIALERAKNLDGGYTDEYTGLYTDRPDVDHIIADEAYHRLYGGWMQDHDKRVAFGADPDNHAVTDQSVNRSMQHKDIKDWESRPNRHDPSVTNKEFYAIDDRRVNAKLAKGEATAKAHAPTPTEVFLYQTKSLGAAAGKTGLMLALRQSMGILLKIFVETTYSAIKEAISKWKEKVITTVKEFIAYIVNKLKRLKDNFRDILKQAGAAAIQGLNAGFLSTLVTFLINCFITTAARIVTVIREGFNTITKTIKTLCDSTSPKQERIKAAVNVFISGMTVCIGVLLLEAVKKWLETVPGINAIADETAQVLVNIMTGLIGVAVFYITAKISERKTNKEQSLKLQITLDRVFSLEQWRIVNSTQIATVQVASTAEALFQTIDFFQYAVTDWMYLLQIQGEIDKRIEQNLKEIEDVQADNARKLEVIKNCNKQRHNGEE